LNPNGNKRGFNIILVESILEGLDFGEVVLRFLELNFNLDRNKIADNPELFARNLEKTFGPWMADIFEKNILQILCRKIGVDYLDIEGLTFPEAIKKAFKKYSEQLKPSLRSVNKKMSRNVPA